MIRGVARSGLFNAASCSRSSPSSAIDAALPFAGSMFSFTPSIITFELNRKVRVVDDVVAVVSVAVVVVFVAVVDDAVVVVLVIVVVVDDAVVVVLVIVVDDIVVLV